MLNRAVTQNRLGDDLREGHCWVLSVMMIGGLLLGGCCFSLCWNEGNLIHNQRAADNALRAVRSVSCKQNQIQSLPSGLVHIQDCPVVLPSSVGNFTFKHLARVLPKNGIRAPWVKLTLQYNSRRRSGGWKDTPSVGTDRSLTPGTDAAIGTRFGDFHASPALIEQVPGERFPLIWREGFKGAFPWSLNSDARELWNGDDRLWVEAGVLPQKVSVLAGVTRNASDNSILLRHWLADKSWNKKIGIVEVGSVDSATMVQHHKDAKFWAASGSRFGLWCFMIFALWLLLWPMDVLACIREGCRKEGQDRCSCLPDRSRSSDLNRCCSTFVRAAGLATVAACIACFTGWLGFEHGFLVGGIGLAIVLLLCVVGEIWQLSRHDHRWQHLHLAFSGPAYVAPEDNFPAQPAAYAQPVEAPETTQSPGGRCGSIMIPICIVVVSLLAANLALSLSFGGARVG